jgi:nitronate monooxygenase
MKTRFTEMFGVKYPIVQGGMQNLGVPKFASVVCNAGGMGTMNITCYANPEEFRTAVKEMKSLTDKPFIVNISLVPDLTKGDEIFRYIDVCIEEGVAAIETAGADPSRFIPHIKDNGIKLIHKTPSAKIAKRMEEKGADVITIAGYEVAGHPSTDGIGTMVLANKVASVCSIPVLAAGGIGDGKGLAAALALGCEGVVMGTRFVATTECIISDNHKQWILDHDERDTASHRNPSTIWPGWANNMAAKLTLEMEARGTTLQELMTVIAGRISKQCYQNGNVDGGIFAVGPVMGIINDIKPVQQLLDGMVAEAEAANKRIAAMF